MQELFVQHQQRIDCFQMHAPILIIETVKMQSEHVLVYERDEVKNLKKKKENDKHVKF